MRTRLLWLLPLGFFGAGQTLRADDTDALKPGKRVRLTTLPPSSSSTHSGAIVGSPVGDTAWTLQGPDGEPMTLARPGKRLVGKLVGSDADTLILKLPDFKEPVRVTRASITGLEASRGRNWGRGSLVWASCAFESSPAP
jgi:hypothetical protein